MQVQVAEDEEGSGGDYEYLEVQLKRELIGDGLQGRGNKNQEVQKTHFDGVGTKCPTFFYCFGHRVFSRAPAEPEYE